MVHVGHVAEDDPSQFVGLVEIAFNRGCESLVLETTWDGVPGVDLKQQVVGLITVHGLGVVGILGLVVIFQYVLRSL